MLRTGFVPPYFDDFVNAKEHVRHLDANEMMAYMAAIDEHRRLQIKLDAQICVSKDESLNDQVNENKE